MSHLLKLIRLESANSALAFRKKPYGSGDRESFLVDILALANAQVAGPRHLVLGVADSVGGDRLIKGVDGHSLASMAERYQRAIDDSIEPALKISMRSATVAGRTLAVIALRDCQEQPYVLRKTISKRLRKGDGWIRRGVHQARLSRADLAAMFGGKAPAPTRRCEIQLVFDGSATSTSLELPALPLSKKPSEVARDRIQGLLEARQAAHERLGKTDTWLDRLAYARVHGADQPYEKASVESLLVKMDKSARDNEAADLYYEHELRAHKVNLLAVNIGDGPLHDAKIIVDVPAIDGVGVADRVYPALNVADDEAAGDYPEVRSDMKGWRIVARLDHIGAGERRTVFEQPLRLLLRPPAAGKTVTIAYTVSGRELRVPQTGSLILRVAEERRRRLIARN